MCIFLWPPGIRVEGSFTPCPVIHHCPACSNEVGPVPQVLEPTPLPLAVPEPLKRGRVRPGVGCFRLLGVGKVAEEGGTWWVVALGRVCPSK